jgi:hypothetical protein
MPEMSPDARAIVDAVQDLTRVTIALHGNFDSRSDAIRRLDELSIPPARIAAILSMAQGDVHSALAKAKKRVTAAGNGRTPRDRRPTAPATDAGIATHGNDGVTPPVGAC